MAAGIEISSEISFRTARSGGKGGQNVNKVETMVEGYFDVNKSSLLDEKQKLQVLSKLKNRINSEGIMQVRSQVHRSQLSNKADVVKKMNELVAAALKSQKKRIATKASFASRAKRLESKKKQAEHKQNRKKIFLSIVIGIALASLGINSCRKSDVTRFPAPAALHFDIPEGFPEPVFDLAAHPLTAEGVALGRQLFHESKLSAYNDVNCGNCHQQHAAFTQFDHDLGHGTNHQHTARNVPAIFNMVWHPVMQWDGSVASLDQQAMACITAPEKMGESEQGIVKKINSDNTYKELFGRAFGDDRITAERISSALTQFVSTIVSANSKYDRVKKGLSTFNASEQAGYDLFKAKCASCHKEPLFSDFEMRDIGLEVNPFHPDYGKDNLNLFKTPSLRNVALTGYFAHDGRYPEFTQMISYYSTSGRIPLSDLERFYLQEFLFTLTDSLLISTPRY